MTLLLAQIVVILLVTLFCGAVARRLGQSKVIGEIIGGIVLGPSVFGRAAPQSFAALFPPASFSSFEILSSLGLILFLFLIGSELDLAHLRRQKSTATLASTLSIAVPFLMALAIAPALHRHFPSGAGEPLVFALFLGISMSITAFPVLARILDERGIQGTALGTTALMCAAVDDLCAWSLLAVAMAMLPSQGTQALLIHRILGLFAYLVVMLGLVRPLCTWVGRRRAAITFSYEMLGVTVAVVLASAAATEAIGVHPLFGAFLAGLCFPRVPEWQRLLRVRLDAVVSVLLLPLFFALTGMKTHLDLLLGAGVWIWALAILFLAIVGKVGGSALAARWTGQSWREAFALGALLNTRGLVELIVLNIAYSAHVFSPALFTIMVMMALITTMMTTPLLNWLQVENLKGTAEKLQPRGS